MQGSLLNSYFSPPPFLLTLGVLFALVVFLFSCQMLLTWFLTWCVKLHLKNTAGGWGKGLVQRSTARCTEAEGERHVRAASGVCVPGWQDASSLFQCALPAFHQVLPPRTIRLGNLGTFVWCAPFSVGRGGMSQSVLENRCWVCHSSLGKAPAFVQLVKGDKKSNFIFFTS